MTRDEGAWLIVRGVGAFFLLFVALDLILILLTSVEAIALRNEAFSDPGVSDDIVDWAIRYGRLITRIWSLGAEVLLKGLLAYYCLHRGAWLHKLLTQNLPSAERS